MNLYNINEERKALAIWQQNLNKSPSGQHALISSGRLAKHNIDIIALQEPAVNFLNKTIASRDWIPIYPTTHDKAPEKTRTVILIRGDVLTESWEQLDFPSGDVTVLRIKEVWGTMTLFNIYNDCEHDVTLEALTAYHRQHTQSILGTEDTQREHHLIWLGDFNRHHPYWDRPEDNRLFTKEAQDAAEVLLKTVADLGMDMALAKGTPTHYHNVTKKWTRLDQVFISEHSMEAVTICDTLPEERGVNTDHVPIVTVIDAELTKAPTQVSRNFRDVDWEKFRTLLEEKLDRIDPVKFIALQSALDRNCEQLTNAVQETIEKEVPHTTICARSKRWWSKELGTLRKETGKLSRKAYKLRSRPDHPIHEELTKTRRKYDKTIQYSKQHHWRDWLEKASDPDLWTAHKYISAPAGDGGKTRIPNLTVQGPEGEHVHSTNQDKGEALAKAFFPKKPQLENNDQGDEVTPAPVCKADPISKEQIRKHIAQLKPFKAPGPDGIPNIVLIKCADILIDRLWRIYSAIVERGLYYTPWKAFTTIVLRKPGKPRYDVPKAYRPIALLNTLSKVLTSIIAEQLTFFSEKYQLLPTQHYGGRPARTTTDALHALIYKIKDAWRKKKVVSVLFLDIEGAFPNAVNEKLLRNMKRRRVPSKLIKFTDNLLRNRTTRLKFDDFTSEDISIGNGIGQGDPLSMVLYQYYNADLLDIPDNTNESAMAYVDDAILIAIGTDFTETHETLSDMMTRKGGAIEWSNDHNSRFEFSKLALMDFAHRNNKKVRLPLSLPSTTLAPSGNTKYLGVYLNQHLDWGTQRNYAVEKGTKWTAQIRRATAPSWGLTPKHARRLFISVAIPRILYAIDVWGIRFKRGAATLAAGKITECNNKLSSVQRAGTLAITGGLRTSPTDALDAHAFILPLHLEIEKHLYRAAVRIATLAPQHPLHKPAKKCANRSVKRHRSTIHELMQAFNVKPGLLETLATTGGNPARTHKRPFKMDIPKDKEASIKADKEGTETIKVYSDGSAQEGKVGAAAVLIRPGKETRKLHYHLGSTDHHTVFEAELVGLLMGLHLIKTEKKRTRYALGVDNQAAITAVATPGNRSGHYLADAFLTAAYTLWKTNGTANYSLKLRWTAGHVKIEGNEMADKEAKLAAEGTTSNANALPRLLKKPLKHNKSAAKQAHKKKLKNAWSKDWNKSPRAKRTKFFDSTVPSTKFIKLISDPNISRKGASWLFQLRTGHFPLNEYLYRFKRAESASCPACGFHTETPQHYILDCPAYAHERWPLIARKSREGKKYTNIIGKPSNAITLINFIHASGRLTYKPPTITNGGGEMGARRRVEAENH
jgi:ribonuclease HI/exonuclease III